MWGCKCIAVNLAQKVFPELSVTSWNYPIVFKVIQEKNIQNQFLLLVCPPSFLPSPPFPFSLTICALGGEMNVQQNQPIWLASEVFNYTFCSISRKNKLEAICLPTTMSFIPIVETAPPLHHSKAIFKGTLFLLIPVVTDVLHHLPPHASSSVKDCPLSAASCGNSSSVICGNTHSILLTSPETTSKSRENKQPW